VVTRRVQRRRDLYRLASGQGGYFTATQARELGYSYQAQAHHVRAGNWERVDRGLFRLPELPVDRHDDLIRASLWSRGRGVVSHESAAAVHELAEIDPLRVHLTVPPTFASTSDAIILHRDQLPATDVEDGAGFRVTTPLRTLVDLGRSGTDVDQLGRAITDGLDRHLVTLRALRRRAEEIDPAAALAVERALLEVSTA
jgi:predicted transcriptional regulator of viral defense system